MRYQASGFTFIETMTVLLVMAVLVSIMVRAVSGSFGASSRRSASREVSAYLYRTRSVAVQRSRPAWLVRQANALKILVDSSGSKVPLGTTIDLSQRYGAALTVSPSGQDTVRFDARGFLLNPTLTPRFIVTRGGSADTICVSGLGRITTRSCP